MKNRVTSGEACRRRGSMQTGEVDLHPTGVWGDAVGARSSHRLKERAEINLKVLSNWGGNSLRHASWGNGWRRRNLQGDFLCWCSSHLACAFHKTRGEVLPQLFTRVQHGPFHSLHYAGYCHRICLSSKRANIFWSPLGISAGSTWCFSLINSLKDGLACNIFSVWQLK